MAKKEKTIRTYPVHNPDDESSGMDLIVREKACCPEKKGESKPGHAGQYKWVSFQDFMKDQNAFAGDHNFKEGMETIPNVGGGMPTFATGSGRAARKSSWKQPTSGKTTMGSQGSMDAAFSEDPTAKMDVNVMMSRLTPDQTILLKTYADQLDSRPEELVQLAISKDMRIEELFKHIEQMG